MASHSVGYDLPVFDPSSVCFRLDFLIGTDWLMVEISGTLDFLHPLITSLGGEGLHSSLYTNIFSYFQMWLPVSWFSWMLFFCICSGVV